MSRDSIASPGGVLNVPCFRWTDSEKQYLERICSEYEHGISYGEWVLISQRFAIEQARHLPGGDLYFTDEWQPRGCTANRFRLAYYAIMKQRERQNELREVARAANILLQFGSEVGGGPGQVAVQAQEGPEVEPLEAGIRLNETMHILIPEGSELLTNHRIRLPGGAIVQIIPDDSS